MAVRMKLDDLPFELTDDLPPFASEENRLLDRELKEKQAKLAQLNAQLEDNDARANAMMMHLKNVRQELQHAQALQSARQKEIETEEHLKQLAERETGRLVVEIRAIEKKKRELTDELSSLQTAIHGNHEKLSKIKREVKMDKEKELEEWLKVQTEKEDDKVALLKYSREDNIKVRDLSLEIERLFVEVQKKKGQLHSEVTETQGALLELDRTTASFKRLHVERQELLKQWEQSVLEMKFKDEELQQAQDRLQLTKQEMQAKQRQLREKENFAAQQTQDNKSTEKALHDLEREHSRLKEFHQNSKTQLTQFSDELAILRATLQKSSSDLRSTQAETSYVTKEIAAKQETLAAAQQQNRNIKERIRDVMELTGTKEEKAEQLLALVKREDQRGKELDKELKALKEFQFKRNQELHSFKTSEKQLTAELTGMKASVVNLSGKINQLESESQKQQAVIYTQEFQLQQLERKIRRAQGDRTEDEKEALLARIGQLTERLELETRKFNLLNSQIRRSQDELRQARQLLEDLTQDKRYLNTNIEDLTIFIDGTNTRLQAKVREKENVLVDENIIRLELNRLRGYLNDKADSVFTLENKHLQLQLVLEERNQEINAQRELLRMQLKQTEEERVSAKTELRERTSKVERLKNRYELLMIQMTAGMENEDNDSTANEVDADGALVGKNSQAFFVIKAAQRREELQNEGDALDAKIRQAEKEIRALENTLKLMDDRQQLYRQTLLQNQLDEKDVQQKLVLEEQYDAAIEKFKAKRAEVTTLQSELSELEGVLQMLTDTEHSKLSSISNWEKQIYSLDKTNNEQQQKRARAKQRLGKLVKEWRKRRNVRVNEMTPEEVELELRFMKDGVQLILARIEEIVADHSDVASFIHDQYQQADIKPPSRPVTRASSRSSVSRASVGTLRSGKAANFGSQHSLVNSIVSSAAHSRSTTSSTGCSSLSAHSSSHFDQANLAPQSNRSRLEKSKNVL